jgi:hypothetical protein
MLGVAPDLDVKTTEAARGRRDQKEQANLDPRQGDEAFGRVSIPERLTQSIV